MTVGDLDVGATFNPQLHRPEESVEPADCIFDGSVRLGVVGGREFSLGIGNHRTGLGGTFGGGRGADQYPDARRGVADWFPGSGTIRPRTGPVDSGYATQFQSCLRPGESAGLLDPGAAEGRSGMSGGTSAHRGVDEEVVM